MLGLAFTARLTRAPVIGTSVRMVVDQAGAVPGKPLRREKRHRKATHARWAANLNRPLAEPRPDDWYAEQCGICRYWIPLTGSWGADWGVCSNPSSALDRQAMFEHDGCEHHDAADRWQLPDEPPTELE